MARYALVVGIAQYDNFRNLDKAATDAAEIARLLQVHGQYQVEPLPKRLDAAENRWELATDKKLTGKDLGQALETFLLEQANGHEALLYFAGHGFEVSGLGRKKKGYLATSDCTSDGRNAILFGDLNDLIRESNLSSLVVILDCCHAGSFLERTLLESTLTAFKEKKDYYLITACRSFERSREGEEHGVFTEAALKGLQAENADSEGSVTGDRLFDFVQRELRQSGQEPIRTGTGQSITLVTYQPQVKAVTAIVDEYGEVICPYQGLQAFTAAQRAFFFGRKRIVESIKQKLEQQLFVPIIGASGSGKSSVVRAGLIPWLEESGWCILEPIKPGFEPLATLRGVFEPFLRRSRSDIQTLHQLIASASTGLSGVIERLPGDDRYLLVVDQFEEVFTVCANEAERRRFIELITPVAEMQSSRLAVVTTMRADFLEPCLHYSALHYLIQSQAVFMPPLTGIDLRDAITEPAKLQGYTVEEALMLQILEDVGKEPGFLPLLEFALTKLWEKRDTGNYLLTLEQYEKLGGLAGALNLHAERVYHYQDYEAEFPSDKRDEQEQEWIKRIFLRLVRTGEGERDTRQRQPKAKLLASGGDDLQKQEALRELLDDEGGLVQGRLLVAGEDEQKADWVDLAHEALIDGWERFVEWRKQDRDLRRLSDRLRSALHEWQNNSTDENLMMGGLLAQIRENWQVLEPELETTEQEFYKRSDAFSKDQERANTYILTDELLTQIRSKKSLWLRPLSPKFAPLLHTFYGHSDCITDLALIPNKHQVISSSNDHTLRVWDINTCRCLHILNGHSHRVRRIIVTPDGGYAISASEDQTLKLWNLETYKPEKTFDEHCGLVTAKMGKPNSNYLLIALNDFSLRSWNWKTNEVQTILENCSGLITAIEMIPNSQHILLALDDCSLKLWNLDSGECEHTFKGHQGSITSVAVFPDAKRAISASYDRTLMLWNLDTKKYERTLRGHSESVTAVVITSNGNHIISASRDHTLRLWDSVSGQCQRTLTGHNDWINRVIITPDGQQVISASDDETLRLWDFRRVEYHRDWVNGIAATPDGNYVVSVSRDRTLKLWNSSTGKCHQTLEGHEDSISAVAVTSDSKFAISASIDKTLKLWDLRERKCIHVFHGHSKAVSAVAVIPNSSQIISASDDKTLKIWDLKTKACKRTLQSHNALVMDVAVTPNGKWAISASTDKTLKIWDLKTGKCQGILKGHSNSVTAVATMADSKHTISASADGTLRLWNIETEVCEKILNAHPGWINAVTVVQGDKWVISASADKTLKIWDLSSEACVDTFSDGESEFINCMAAPNKAKIFAGDQKGRVQFFQVEGLE